MVLYYSYSWEISNDEISCYCLDVQSKPTIIHYVDYKPYLMLTSSQFDNNSVIYLVLDYLDNILSQQGHSSLSHKIYETTNSTNIDKTTTCLEMRFRNWDARRHCINIINKIKKINIDSNVVDLELCNISIPDIIYLLSDLDLDITGWIEPIDLVNNVCSGFRKCDVNIPLYPLIMSYDIECNSSTLFRMPKSYLLDDAIVMISTLSKIYMSDIILDKTIFVLESMRLDNVSIEDLNIIYCKNEIELIRSFFEHILRIDPVITAGYNVFGFDIPYIVSRLELRLLDIPIDISRDRSGTRIDQIITQCNAYGNYHGTILISKGRLNMDLLTIFRRNNKLNVRTLGEISRIYLNDIKDELSPIEMFKIFKSPTRSSITKVIKYCVKDSLLVLNLIDKLDMWTTWTEESASTFVSIDDLYIKGATYRALSLFFRECIKRKIAIYKHKIPRYNTMGGYVFDPMLGYHSNVTCVDFKSLYPSIMIEHNICTSTYLGVDNGVYRFSNIKTGIIPGILLSLINKRTEINTIMKKEKDARIRSILNARQLSLKICANGIYGVLSTPYDHILCFSPAAEEVTRLGRYYVTSLRHILENKYSFTCIYGDTDSCYITDTSLSKKELIDATINAISDVNNTLPTNIKLAFETYANAMFIITKKKYVLIIDNEMINKGNVSIRKDNCEYTRTIYNRVLEMVLIEKVSRNVLYNYLIGKYDSLAKGDVNSDSLVFTCPVRESYKSPSNQYGIMVERLRRSGYDVSVNDRLQYLFISLENNNVLQGHKMYTHEEVLNNGYIIDYVFYLRNKVANVINTLVNLLGYEDIASRLNRDIALSITS